MKHALYSLLTVLLISLWSCQTKSKQEVAKDSPANSLTNILTSEEYASPMKVPHRPFYGRYEISDTICVSLDDTQLAALSAETLKGKFYIMKNGIPIANKPTYILFQNTDATDIRLFWTQVEHNNRISYSKQIASIVGDKLQYVFSLKAKNTIVTISSHVNMSLNRTYKITDKGTLQDLNLDPMFRIAKYGNVETVTLKKDEGITIFGISSLTVKAIYFSPEELSYKKTLHDNGEIKPSIVFAKNKPKDFHFAMERKHTVEPYEGKVETIAYKKETHQAITAEMYESISKKPNAGIFNDDVKINELSHKGNSYQVYTFTTKNDYGNWIWCFATINSAPNWRFVGDCSYQNYFKPVYFLLDNQLSSYNEFDFIQHNYEKTIKHILYNVFRFTPDYFYMAEHSVWH